MQVGHKLFTCINSFGVHKTMRNITIIPVFQVRKLGHRVVK